MSVDLAGIMTETGEGVPSWTAATSISSSCDSSTLVFTDGGVAEFIFDEFEIADASEFVVRFAAEVDGVVPTGACRVEFENDVLAPTVACRVAFDTVGLLADPKAK